MNSGVKGPETGAPIQQTCLCRTSISCSRTLLFACNSISTTIFVRISCLNNSTICCKLLISLLWISSSRAVSAFDWSSRVEWILVAKSSLTPSSKSFPCKIFAMGGAPEKLNFSCSLQKVWFKWSALSAGGRRGRLVLRHPCTGSWSGSSVTWYASLSSPVSLGKFRST